jgi:hypothetical protein
MEEFIPTLVHMGFTIDKVALEQDLLLALRFPSAIAIPPLLCINLLSSSCTVFLCQVEIPRSNWKKTRFRGMVASIHRIIIQKIITTNHI